MNTQPSTNARTHADENPTLLQSSCSENTWRYRTVSVLLFAIELQYKLLMLPVLAVVACLRFSVLSVEKLGNALTLVRDISPDFVSQD